MAVFLIKLETVLGSVILAFRGSDGLVCRSEGEPDARRNGIWPKSMRP